MTLTTTYSQLQANAHAVGGQTQTEATARISVRVLDRASVGYLNSILASLQVEANSATTMAEYGDIRKQILRVRHALEKKGAL